MARRLFLSLLAAAMGIAALVSSPSTTFAQPQCDRRDNVLAVLEDKYGESPVALGVTSNGGLVEVLATGDGATWSIIVTNPQGMSCLVAAGEGWRALEQIGREPGQGS